MGEPRPPAPISKTGAQKAFLTGDVEVRQHDVSAELQECIIHVQMCLIHLAPSNTFIAAQIPPTLYVGETVFCQ